MVCKSDNERLTKITKRHYRLILLSIDIIQIYITLHIPYIPAAIHVING